MKTLISILFTFCFLITSGCNGKQISNNPEIVTDSTEIEQEVIEDYYHPNKQSIDLFTLSSVNDASIAFVSLSDIYSLSEHPDSAAIPDIKRMGEEAAKYFKLEGKYRRRFLTKTEISETDSAFVYNYKNNESLSFLVKDLQVKAMINVYASSEDWAYSQFEYMIGFEINGKELEGFKDSLYDIFFYVGKENPFAGEKLVPIIWKKIVPEKYPSKEVRKDYAEFIKDLPIGNTYLFEAVGLQYFLQDYTDNDGQVSKRRLLVLETNTKEVIIEKVFGIGEGTSPCPLNYENVDLEISQWTGKLLKNKPPVVFGFEYISFGCPFISVIDKSNEDIYLNCDNRH